jgi:outer membrane protein TolC
MSEAIHLAYENSPEIRSREKMIASAEAKVKMAKKEYYPDFTVAASLFKRAGEFEDMWSLTTTVNIPIFYRTKQKQAVHEAEASLSEAQHELEGAKTMLSSGIRDNFSMLRTADKLMDLYRKGLIPKTYQDFESALSGYVTGKVEAITTITRLKTILDFETSYWGQFSEREKAIARLEALTGITDPGIRKGNGESEKRGNGGGGSK